MRGRPHKAIPVQTKELCGEADEVCAGILVANCTSTAVSSPISTLADASGGLPHKKVRHTQGFFLFPEPLACLLKPQPGYVWVVFLVIWRQSTMKRSFTVSITSTELLRFGVTRMQKARALAALTQLGVLTVTRQGRKNPRVTLEVDTPPWKH